MASLGTWPTTIRPRCCRMVMNASQLVNASPFGGSEQVVDKLNDRWAMSLTLPVRRHADAAAVEAFLANFRGQVNWIDAWHFARPAPLGTLRGSLYTHASAAQGAAALQVQARRARLNRFVKTAQLSDAAAWTTPETITDDVAVAPDGTTTASTLAVAGSEGGFYQVPVGSPSEAVTYVVYVKQGTSEYLRFGLTNQNESHVSYYVYMFSDQSMTLTTNSFTNVSAQVLDAGGGWLKFVISGTAPEAGIFGLGAYLRAATGTVHVWHPDFRATADYEASPAYQRVDTPADFDVVDYAQAGKTLKAGDMLGAGGALLMVAADVTTDSEAKATVSLVNRLRAAIGADVAVTWDKPTAPFRVVSHGGVNYVPGSADEVTLELREKVGA